MKNKHVIVLILSCIILAECNYSKGVKKDLLTGLSCSYNGFVVRNVLLTDPFDKPKTDNKVQLNTQIAIVANGVTNYGLKDGKVFPGMMIVVTDKRGNIVVQNDDLFVGDQGHPPADATELRGTIAIARPMNAGEVYHVKMRIWDKIKPNNELNAETDLVVR